MLELLLKGFGLGLAIAAPVGPIGVLVIRRSISEGRIAGLASGLGAATADALYGLIATLGLSAISSVLVGIQFWTRLAGGVFLLYLAWSILRSKPATESANVRGTNLGVAYLSTLGLTLSNPATIISFFGIVAGLGVNASSAPWAVVLGFFLGSSVWWLCLSSGAAWLGSRLTAWSLGVVNIGSSLIIAGFGVLALAGLF